MTDPRWILRRELRSLRWPQAEADALGLVYRGPADFVLREGRWWPTSKPRPNLPQGRPRACYGNTIAAAVVFGLRYVQGFAISPVESELAVPHAWNVDADGNVVDLTWWPTGAVYLGVEMSIERADDATWNGDADPVNDYYRGWPLLRRKWRGELVEPDPAWIPSPMLLALRARAAGDDDEVRRQWALAERELASDRSAAGAAG